MKLEYFFKENQKGNKMGYKKSYICCLCKQTFHDFGNNPSPLKSRNRKCCDMCNYSKVIPARLKLMGIKEMKTKEFNLSDKTISVKEIIEECDDCNLVKDTIMPICNYHQGFFKAKEGYVKIEDVLKLIDDLALSIIKVHGISIAGKYRSQGLLEFKHQLKEELSKLNTPQTKPLDDDSASRYEKDKTAETLRGKEK